MLATALVAMAARVSAQASPDSLRVHSQNVTFNSYLHDLVRPGVVAGTIGGSVLQQMRGTRYGPPELEDKIEERFARRAVVISVRDGAAALMHLSPSNRFQRCQCSGFGRRVGHALLESFTAHRADGSRVVAIPRFASAYAGGMTQLAWSHDRTAGQIALGTTLSFGVNALMNVVKELSPAWHVRLPLIHREVVLPFAK